MSNKINIILSNNKTSRYVEVKPTEFLIIDLTEYTDDIDDISIESEGKVLNTTGFQPITTEVMSNIPRKNPWEFI